MVGHTTAPQPGTPAMSLQTRRHTRNDEEAFVFIMMNMLFVYDGFFMLQFRSVAGKNNSHEGLTTGEITNGI
jgi:hypothetical protein